MGTSAGRWSSSSGNRPILTAPVGHLCTGSVAPRDEFSRAVKTRKFFFRCREGITRADSRAHMKAHTRMGTNGHACTLGCVGGEYTVPMDHACGISLIKRRDGRQWRGEYREPGFPESPVVSRS